MIARTLAASCAALVVSGVGVPAICAAPAPAAAPDNLMLVTSTQLRRVYVAPGADFRPFKKIILEPTEVAFADNWVRDFNRTQRSTTRRLSDSDAQRIKNDVSTGLQNTFTLALRNAGYMIVNAPGPDVMRLHTAVANLAITAPDLQTPGRSRTFSETAGEATLVLEVRNSRSNALLGRALDRRIAGNTRTSMRNSVTNRSDFQRVGQIWARATVEDLAALKEASPVRPGTQPGRH
jgi:hypothetical protein